MVSTSAATRPVDAASLASLAGFAPPTLHSLGTRAAHGLARRTYSVAITNVPGPQVPLYAAGARMTEMFPLLPLHEGHAVAIALTSYDGGVCFGVSADAAAVPDAAELGSALEQAATELSDAAALARPAGARKPLRAARRSRT
jgi:hypothetical protein